MGILKGKTELGKGGRARRYYELCDCELCLIRDARTNAF
ncbi:MAG: hypothetical protein KAT65_25340 [Methanophagales archaeon]|nr:hypothetical protein [Methanophagales archaeon]